MYSFLPLDSVIVLSSTTSMDNGATIVILFVVAIAALTVLSTRTYFSSKHPLLDKIRSNFTKIDPAYAKIPLRVGDSAYTENKEVITLCLRDDKGDYYDLNTLMYVSLHELAHIVTPEGKEEHGSEFKKNFSELLARAAMLGVYNPKKPIPATYCKVETGA